MESKEVVCNEQYCIKGEVMPFNLTLSGGMSFQEYMDKVQGLMGADKTTGQDHSEILLHYTKMNVKRMLRWDKTIELLPELQSFFSELELDLNFMVITEAWCGDAAPIVPLVNKIASTNPRFSMTAILRDDHPEIMERYLTNGAKSIPIVVVLLKMKDQYLELCKWGPRPQPMMEKMFEFKSGKLNISKMELLEELQNWYNQDKTITAQNEMLVVVKNSLDHA